jgi:signal transduction histidine kinase
MYSKKRHSFVHTVTFRLTLFFIVLFALLLVAVFIPIDYTLKAIMLDRLDAKITTHMANFSYYDLLFERHSEEKAIGTIVDNLKWAADIDSSDDVLWLFLSKKREIITSSNTRQWQQVLKTIIAAMPEMPHHSELPQPIRPETLNKDGFNYVEISGVKQIAALKILSFPGKPGRFRTVFMKYKNGMAIIAVYSLKDIDRLMTKYRKVLAIAFGFVLVLGAGLGFFTTKRAMLGVQRVTKTAMAIGQGGLGSRVTVGREGREIADMAIAFNEMLGRIQMLVKELKEVTTNIAHDLRSPITRIRGVAETALQSQAPIETYQEAGGRIITECDRLIGIINTMLDIAEMDSGTAKLPDNPVDVAVVVKDACELFHPVAEDKAVELQLKNNSEPLVVRGSREGLQRVVANIIDNAIKFTSQGGQISIEVDSTDTQVSICIIDTGIGLTEESQRHIFDRFFQVDSSRSAEGNGLGLSLARSIVRAHGGDITVESQVGKGSRFTIILPRY